MPKVQVAFSADDTYFPLAKGLVLSILYAGPMPASYELAFIDLGCSPDRLSWLQQQGVNVVPFDEAVIGQPLAGLVSKKQHGQIIRPFLPRIFPGADAIIWLDSDVWIQSPDVLPMFATLAQTHPNNLFICPEWHFSYIGFNAQFVKHQANHAAKIYEPLYGHQVAQELSTRPTLNTGVFAMASRNPIWELWAQELHNSYSRSFAPGDRDVRHMVEQTSLNFVAAQHNVTVPIDPLLNYLCMWALPIRDSQGIVRVAFPPNFPISVIHLVQWSVRRKVYAERGLLYDSGKYLTEQEMRELLL